MLLDPGTYTVTHVLAVHPAITDSDEFGAALATQCFRQAQLSTDAKMGVDGEALVIVHLDRFLECGYNWHRPIDTCYLAAVLFRFLLAK